MRIWRKHRPSVLMEPIALILTKMNAVDPKSDEFDDLVTRLDALMRMKEREEDSRLSIDPNTLLIVAGNLLGILVIVAYEQKHVMVSRALGFVNRTEPKI